VSDYSQGRIEGAPQITKVSSFATPLAEMKPGKTVPPAAINTYMVWLGGDWILRRDGKAVPIVGPIVDTEKDPQHNALYEDSSKPKGKKKWLMEDQIAYGHLPIELTIGAVCPEDVLEWLLQRDEHRMQEQLVRVEDPIKREEFIAKRLDQIRKANKPGESWDGKTPLPTPENTMVAENKALKARNRDLLALLEKNGIKIEALAGAELRSRSAAPAPKKES
jgi:hypothetical protein